jgi:hypothetical protein
MKKIVFILVIVGILFSCNNDDGSNLNTELIGNWKLIKSTGSIPNSETTGSEMEWQELYSINTDGTFLKHRERNNIITEITGTYITINSSDGLNLELTYDSESTVIGTTSGLKELFYFQDNIMVNTWWFADGPKLEYKKIK